MSFRLLRRLLPAVLLAGSVACFDDKDDDDEDDEDEDDSGYDWGTATGTTTGTTGTGGPAVSVNWGSSGIDVDISGGSSGWFGMAETYDCDDCWTGEDCVYGYSYSGGSLNYCHSVGGSGTSLTYGGDAGNLMSGTTVFPDASFESYVTYYLEQDDGSCYVWGADPSYYDGLGCSSL